MSVREGKQVIYLFRPLANAATEAASVIAFQSDGSESISNDTEITATKDGPVTTAGTPEIEISCTALASTESREVLDALKDACKNGDIVECWKVNRDIKGDESQSEQKGKYLGTYYQGKISEFNENESAEDMLEAEITYAVDGVGADGWCTLSAEQEEAAAYSFTDTTQAGA